MRLNELVNGVANFLALLGRIQGVEAVNINRRKLLLHHLLLLLEEQCLIWGHLRDTGLLISAVSIAVAALLEGSASVAISATAVVELATLASSTDLAIIALLEVAATLAALEITLTEVVSLVHRWSISLHYRRTAETARTSEL